MTKKFLTFLKEKEVGEIFYLSIVFTDEREIWRRELTGSNYTLKKDLIHLLFFLIYKNLFFSFLRSNEIEVVGIFFFQLNNASVGSFFY